jgi:hypothetical protein
VFETCAPAQFHPDNKRVYLVTNVGPADLVRLVPEVVPHPYSF